MYVNFGLAEPGKLWRRAVRSSPLTATTGNVSARGATPRNCRAQQDETCPLLVQAAHRAKANTLDASDRFERILIRKDIGSTTEHPAGT